MADTKKENQAKEAAEQAVGKGDTHLVIVVDESGSMSGKEEAVVSGVNEFIHRFKEEEGDHRATVVWFDDTPGQPRVRFGIDNEKVDDVELLDASDYRPRGGTPLYDAVIQTIRHVEDSEKADEGVFFAILTDGHENASETSASQVQDLVKKKEDAGWAFLFLGANINVEHAAANLGLKRQGQAFMFMSSAAGTNNAMKTSSNLARSYAGARRTRGAAAGSEAYAAQSASVSLRTGGKLAENEEVEVEETDLVK